VGSKSGGGMGINGDSVQFIYVIPGVIRTQVVYTINSIIYVMRIGITRVLY